VDDQSNQKLKSAIATRELSPRNCEGDTSQALYRAKDAPTRIAVIDGCPRRV
jgi:hypothetical protein